jgi:Tol biopolymer transport system component
MNRAAALALVASMFLPVSAHALHRQTAALVQVTPTSGAGDVANPRWSGFRYVVFDSDTDLAGTGNGTRQIFLFDLRTRNRTGTLAIEQLTTGAGDYQRPTAARRARKIAYDGLDGGGVRQIYVSNRKTGATDAITAGTADSRNAELDEVGRVLTFESETDFFNTGAGGTQVYLVELRLADPACPYPCAATNNFGLVQITNKSGTSHGAVTAKAGRTIVFESDADLLNQGETGNQIYARDLAGTLALLSHGPGEGHNATVSRNGRQIAFDFDGDLLSTGSTGRQLFMQRRLISPLEQMTNAAGGHSVEPSASTTGRLVSFVSTDDLAGTGSSGPELFVLNARRGTIDQITNGTSTIMGHPTHSSGVFTAFVADGDLLGNGTTGPALYVVNLFGLGSGTVP